VSWLVASFAILAFALAGGFAWYERAHPTTRALALVATLAALAALGRVAFAPLPNVKPTTDVVLLGGYVLGGAPGFAVGAVAALASNLFFGQGPWTPWQMAAWGLTGLMGAGLAAVAGRELGRVVLAAACALAGLVYGAILNVSLWVMYSGDHTWAKLAATFATSLPFDLVHAGGNAAFCLAFGPALVRALARFRTRMDVRWLPAGAAVAVLAALVVAVPAPAPAGAAVPATRAPAAWLLHARNADGGWGVTPGQPSNALYTGWAALGVAAAGTNPVDAGAVGWIRAHPALSDLGAVSRTVLVLRAAGLPAGDLAGRIAARQSRSGAWEGRVNTTAFALLALRAAGRGGGAMRRGAGWLARQENADGGFNFAGRGGASGVDDTGAALQALAAAGRGRSGVASRTAAWLARQRNGDGGFPLVPGGPSNAQSTAWAIQGLIATGRAPGPAPFAYLRRMTTASGMVRYSAASAQTPVWVTGQALMALARKPLPLAPVARRAVHRAPRRAAPAPAPAATAAPAPTAAPADVHRRAARPARRRAPATKARPPVPARALVGALLPERLRAAGFLVGTVVRVSPWTRAAV
jgi:energy-coupling factor transport system substrate-specific component